MVYVFRALALVMALGLILNMSLAQVSKDELPAGAADNLAKPGARESHQGPDNPMQGNRSGAQGRFGGPDPYGPEGFREFMDKAETSLNDPQWQLKLDLQHPKRIVINHPNGTSREYWYVMFRVINDNTRQIKSTQLPEPHTGDPDPTRLAEPLRVQDTSRGEREGVPANAHLDFELHVFTRDVERDPWDTAWPEEPEDEVLSREALEQRRANMKRVHRPVSDQYVLQRIAAAEGMYEWMGNYDFINEPVMMLHPLSDFQRQIGLVHELSAPDYSGPRCLAYRTVIVDAEGRSEAMRYVAVYGDNSFAGFFGEGDEIPSGARLVNSPSDAMWGRLTVPRYQAGDAIDRFGRALRANDPGYLQARIAGGAEGAAASYGVLRADHPAVNTPVRVPHVRLYQDGDRVLVNYDTGVPHAERPNATYRINGKIVSGADSRFDRATEIDSGTQIFGSSVVGRPVKQIDQRGRAIRNYIVTYQAGDVLTQAEWDIYRRRLGPGILSRYSDIENIVGRPLTHNDPVVGLPKIKMGNFTGDASARRPESIDRGIDTGRRGPRGEVILEAAEGFVTGRPYDPRAIGPEHFQRDPDGEFTTNRVAPLPQNHGLRAGEEYVYAPLGQAGQGAVPVPRFDQYGAWMDYRDELSGERIPLYDDEGELVRDMQDQILYLKEYEYEYVYMYEYQPQAQDDDGYRGRFGGEQYRLRQTEIDFAIFDNEGGAAATPLARMIWEDRPISVPEMQDAFQVRDEQGVVRYVSAQEYEQITGAAPDPSLATKVIGSTQIMRPMAVGVYHDGTQLSDGQREESWEEARQRVESAGGRVERRSTLAFVERFRTQGGEGPRADEMEDGVAAESLEDLESLHKTWSRWTVPPPLVYRGADGQWQVVTRFADQLGPGRRWDNKDAPRFLTRYVSEMWGVAIFEEVGTDWDFANVYVRGLRHSVGNSGLKRDNDMTELPNPLPGARGVPASFFKPRLVGQEWIYRVRYERLGDEFDAYRDVVRRTRSFWYMDTSPEYRERELDN
jgi:hypothetical protein